MNSVSHSLKAGAVALILDIIGTACGKMYRVAVMTISEPGDSDILEVV